MDLSERHKRTSSFFTMCQSVLSKKGAQYVSPGEDAYATFNRLANCAEVSTTTGMAVLLAKQVQGLVTALKALPREATDKFLAKFGVQRIKDLPTSQVEKARAFVEQLQTESAAPAAAETEVDPFA